MHIQVVVMMLWTKGLSLMLIEGTAPSMRQGPMYVRMLLFWAVSLTMAGNPNPLPSPNPNPKAKPTEPQPQPQP
jgi:hypothetical protein